MECKVLKYFTLAVCLFATSFAIAAPISPRIDEVWEKTLPDQKRLYLIVHLERKTSWVELASQNARNVSILLTRHVFKEQAALQKYFEEQKRQGFRRLSKAEMKALDIPTTEVPGESLWKVTESWNWEWELKYAQWIQENVTPDFFSRHNIPIDCADVPIALKWIFAREYGLPAANTVGGFGVTFSQDSVRTRWLALPTAREWFKDLRFLEALDYLLGMTDTRTFYLDSYPISVSPKALLPGVHHLEFHGETGHVMLIRNIDLSNSSTLPLDMVAATVPRAIRDLTQNGYWNSAQPTEESGGFMRIRWPLRVGNEWVLQEGSAHPHYSREQYSEAFMGTMEIFSEAVLSRLNPHLDYQARLKEGIQFLKDQLVIRAKTVQQGFEFCSSHDCAKGGVNYYTWSTPARDARITDSIRQLESLVTTMAQTAPGIEEIWKHALDQEGVTVAGETYPLGVLLLVWKQGFFSSEPFASVEDRWGVSSRPFVTGFRSKLQSYFKERESRPSVKLDDEISDYFDLAAEYCLRIGEARCSAFKQQAGLVTVLGAGRRRTLADWMERAPFLQIQWGDHQPRYRHLFLEDADAVQITSSGYAWTGLEKYRLVDLLRKREVHPDPGFVFKSFAPEQNLVVAQSETGLKVFRPGQLWSHDQTFTPGISFEARWVTADHLGIWSGQSGLDKTDFWAFQPQPVLVNSLPVRPLVWDAVTPGVLLTTGDRGEGSNDLVFLDEGQWVRRPVRGQLTAHQRLDALAFNFPHYAAGLLIDCQNRDCAQPKLSGFYAISKKDGELQFPWPQGVLPTLSSDGRYAFWNETASGQGQKEQLVLASLGADLKLVSRRYIPAGKLNQIQRVAGAEYFETIEDPGVRRLFRYKEGQLEEFRLLPDERRMVQSSQGLVVVELVNSAQRLRRFGSSRALFEIFGAIALPPLQQGSPRAEYFVAYSQSDPARGTLYDVRRPGEPILKGKILDHLRSPNVITALGNSSVNRGVLLHYVSGRKLWLERRQ